MSSKEGLCLWCGRFTESRSLDGFADCDREECVTGREYADAMDRAGGIKFWLSGDIWQYDQNGEFAGKRKAMDK
jgi:hypothetical protein